MTLTSSRPVKTAMVAPHPPVLKLAVLALAVGAFGIGTTEFVAMGLLPEMASSLGISEPTAGHVISAYALGVVVGAPVIAVLAAKVPRRTLLLALMAVFTIGNLVSAIAPSYSTMLGARFIAGLPHGAYFGVAALVAAQIMGPRNRAKAVAQVMTGLTVATVIGVPVASWLGQGLGWRAAFVLVVAIGLATLTALWFWMPALPSVSTGNPLTELGALRRPQVWFALVIGMVGFGGMFAVYTYIATTLTDVSGMSRGMVPVGLMVFGLGMVVGNLVGGWMADKAVIRSLYLSIGALAVVLAIFIVAAHNPVTALIVLFGIGAAGSAIAPALQTRLMDVAADAQTLAASLNHSALNIANATGAWVGGVVIAAGFGYTAPAAAGAGLAIAGLLVLTLSLLARKKI